MDERAWALRAYLERPPRGALEIAHVTALTRCAREEGMSVLAQGEWRSVIDGVAAWAEASPSVHDQAAILCELADLAAARLDDPDRAVRWYVRALSLTPAEPSIVERATLYLSRLGAHAGLAQVLRAQASILETAGTQADARRDESGREHGAAAESELAQPALVAASVEWRTPAWQGSRLATWLKVRSGPMVDRARRVAPRLLVPFDQRPTTVRRRQGREEHGLAGPSVAAIVGWLVCLAIMFTLEGDHVVGPPLEVFHVTAHARSAAEPVAAVAPVRSAEPANVPPEPAAADVPLRFSLPRARLGIRGAGLGQREVERAFAAVFDAARACPLGLGRGERLAVDVTLLVRPSGRIARVSTRGIPAREEPFRTCLEEQLRQTRYPEGERERARVRARLEVTR